MNKPICTGTQNQPKNNSKCSKPKGKDHRNSIWRQEHAINYQSIKPTTSINPNKSDIVRDINRKQSCPNGESLNKCEPKKFMDAVAIKQFQKNTRAQTPDPAATSRDTSQQIIYPKPDLILKQIEKNVNFLKQMYYASLSHHQSHQSHEDASHPKDQVKNNRKSMDSGWQGHRKMAEIIVEPMYQPQGTGKLKGSKKQAYHDFIEPGAARKSVDYNSKKSKEDKKQGKRQQSKQRSESGELKKSKDRRDSSGNQKNKTSKNASKSKETSLSRNPSADFCSPNAQRHPTNKTANATSLFEIFQYYKRSIDSGLSMKGYATQLDGNSGLPHCKKGVNISTSNRNQSTIDQKSNKETPNNSTTKNTNHKNSTTTRNCGSSFDPSIEVSIDEHDAQRKQPKNPTKDQESKVYDRKDQDQIVLKSGKDRKSESRDRKKGSKGAKETRERKEANVQGTHTSRDQSRKVRIKDMEIKNNKEEGKKKADSKDKQLKGSEGGAFKKKQSKKVFIEKWKNNSLEHVGHKVGTQQHQQGHYDQIHDKIEFPEIQSSLFNRNMPILEEDSREEASSSFLALTAHKNQTDDHFSGSHRNIFTKENEFLHSNMNALQERMETPPMAQFAEKNKSSGLEQRGQGQVSRETKKSDDSLAGFEIPKRDSDSDLDHFELISFEL